MSLTRTEMCAAALAELPSMTPRCLNSLLENFDAQSCWDMLSANALPKSIYFQGLSDKHASWVRTARSTDVRDVGKRYEEAGIQVLIRGVGMPMRLQRDPFAPAVLFVRGNEQLMSGPSTVAVIGTRRCSHEGRTLARRLGAELCEAGVAVVSGLALGIDGAAHEGALAGDSTQAVGVVGSGLDVIYPRRHRQLWEAVATRGVLVSEAPLGSRPEPWRFPARNRIIAGLADAVVVVESGESGGSLLTVTEADDRTVPVFAVPGSLFNQAAVGTNTLLESGNAHWFRNTEDVLGMIGHTERLQSNVITEANGSRRTAEMAKSELELLDVMTSQPSSLEQLALRSTVGPSELVVRLAKLEAKGLVENQGGYWQRLIV